MGAAPGSVSMETANIGPQHRHTAASAAVRRQASDSQPAVRSAWPGSRLYEATIEMAPDATVVIGSAGRVRLVNRQTEVLFGYAREELLGQPAELLIPERVLHAHRQHRAAFAAAPRMRQMGANLPLFGRRRDGSEFPVEVSLAPLHEDGEPLVIASIRDVTDVQRVQASNQELRLLLALTDTALTHLELDELLPEVLSRVGDVLAVDNAAILLLDTQGRELRVRAARGPEEAVASEVRVPLGQGFAGRIAASHEPLIVADLSTFPVVNPLLHEHLHSAVGVPLLLGERVVGVLHIGTTEPHSFTQQDVQLLERVAERVAVAIEHAQLYEAEQQARRDAEAALLRALASEQRFRRLMDSGIIGILVSDGERVLEANAAFLHMLGYTRADLEAGTLTRQTLLTQADILASSDQAMREALATGQCQPFERT
jgi:PAS domain S-box-containing protein